MTLHLLGFFQMIAQPAPPALHGGSSEPSAVLRAGEAIAEALGMNYTFLCEFEELHSPVRDARSQARFSSVLWQFELMLWHHTSIHTATAP